MQYLQRELEAGDAKLMKIEDELRSLDKMTNKAYQAVKSTEALNSQQMMEDRGLVQSKSTNERGIGSPNMPLH